MATSRVVLLIAITVVAFVLHRAIAWYQFNRKYKLPPKVPGWPIIGNTLDVPFPAGMWLVETSKKYGEMFTCDLAGKTLVFLNSNRVVNDIMEKHAAITAARQYRPMTSEIMSGGRRMLLMSHTDRWRNQRKVMHSQLNGKQAETNFVPYQELESRHLVWDYLNKPEKFYLANQRFSNSVIVSVVFGRRARLDDKQLAIILGQMAEFGKALFSPIVSPADLFPVLAKLPKQLQWWRPYGERFFQETLAVYQRELDLLKDKMAKGTAKPCFAINMMNEMEKKEFASIDDAERLMILSTLFEAGSDTSRTVITQIVAAAAKYPRWVKKAQEVLDEVCGANAERLPLLSDRPSLPYIMAVVKEGLRWRPFLQMGVPHMLSEDLEYEGYKFPAGTQFTWGAYALALNEDDYPDARTFNPERFMNEDLKAPLKGHWSFGAGRRVCVGYNVGVNNVWIATACLLYCFDFAEDPDHPIDEYISPWDKHDGPPFHVRITPRSQVHIDLIKRESAHVLSMEY
ncbi:uncharacterized protein Z520_02819 [Fonsecaea multimorphosa CBS 102226]|uniref:Cytochrome P450 n=1 Tax=Fonsecaea multimorphosa CBS 102226 TaxID=1442371 RepID=A0A0D2IW37_9EURO|nr:uncharacterized protein Z520_02819 [Fonsecaea multimorphosa CBS 102226]KIY01267.1 hypothetical protein Z520_02819 [Fonsecaea multimorphosa CBS 102226]OAL28546.1 hypothetical protein AYO22_02740 [Fonsecaea multimorphosa]